MPDIRESDPHRTDWLKFGTMEQALDAAVPPDVAQIGVGTTIADYEAGPNFDSDMLLLKGIMCGALCGISATEVMHIMTDDMPEAFFNYDHDDYLAELEKDELHECSYVDMLAQCYYGRSDRGTHARRFEFVRKSSDGNSSYYFAGTVQVFRCVFQTSDLGAVNPDPLAEENPNFWVDVVYVQMEADGGPPGDLFLVKHVDDRS